MRMDRAQKGEVSTLWSHLLNRAHLAPSSACEGARARDGFRPEGRLPCWFPKEPLFLTNSPALPSPHTRP